MAGNTKWTPSWNARALLVIPEFHCAAKSTSGYVCSDTISEPSRAAINRMLNLLPELSLDPDACSFRCTLQRIAAHSLCVDFHRSQEHHMTRLVNLWKETIRQANNEEWSEFTKARDGYEKWQRRPARWAENRSRREKLPAEVAERLRYQWSRRLDEAIAAEERRCRSEEDARARAETRQEHEQEQHRNCREREAEPKTAMSWEAKWAIYNQQWADFDTLDANSNAAQIASALPTPCGTSSNATFESEVKIFFSNMPQIAGDGRTNLRRHLETIESRRWHPDKLMQRFPNQDQSRTAVQRATRVMQVISQMLLELS